MTETNFHLSVLVPVYNSGSFLLRSLIRLDEFMDSLACSAELVLVDDGSKDNSSTIIREWSSGQKKYSIRTVFLDKNRGKGAAVAAGMLAARGKFRIFLDADMAYQPSQILRIIEALEDGAQVAVASRVHPESRYTISPAFFHYLYTRHIASRVINFIMRRTIIPDCHDSQAGLKGFSALAAEAIFSRQQIHGFPFDIEALFLAKKMGFSVRDVAVDYNYFNEPTTVVFMQDGMDILRAIWRIHAHYLKGGYNLPQREKIRKLIINADDFGMTLPVSRGIIKVADAGIVKSASAMTNSPEFEVSMDELSRTGVELDVGLHITLTWGRPVLPAAEVRTLVDKNGRFFSKFELLIRAILGKLDKDEVCREIRAQCEKLVKRRPKVSHLDSHHHVHIFPVIRDAAQKTACDYHIKFIRAPREGLWSGIGYAFFKRLFVSFFSASKPRYWQSRGFSTSDHFGGFLLGAGGRNPAQELKNKWFETLKGLQSGVTEIMVHPGYVSQNDDAYNGGREIEIDVLTDGEFMNSAKALGVKIESYSIS